MLCSHQVSDIILGNISNQESLMKEKPKKPTGEKIKNQKYKLVSDKELDRISKDLIKENYKVFKKLAE